MICVHNSFWIPAGVDSSPAKDRVEWIRFNDRLKYATSVRVGLKDELVDAFRVVLSKGGR